MPTITTILPEQVDEARRLIYVTAHEIFHEYPTLEESIRAYSENWPLRDMADGCRHYFENDGIFLVMVEDPTVERDQSSANPRIIGTGAIRCLEGDICELRRLWFLHEYHGRGLGYQMITHLMRIAREKGYRRMRLCTSPDYQTRAVAFYHRLGFYEIPRYNTDEADVSMECVLEDIPLPGASE